jgi:hypothetical protein
MVLQMLSSPCGMRACSCPRLAFVARSPGCGCSAWPCLLKTAPHPQTPPRPSPLVRARTGDRPHQRRARQHRRKHGGPAGEPPRARARRRLPTARKSSPGGAGKAPPAPTVAARSKPSKNTWEKTPSPQTTSQSPQVGWDTDEFLTDPRECLLMALAVVRNGGLGAGGINFDAKLRWGLGAWLRSNAVKTMPPLLRRGLLATGKPLRGGPRGAIPTPGHAQPGVFEGRALAPDPTPEPEKPATPQKKLRPDPPPPPTPT